jgi:D-glycero-D-manno-heptose 1,7-bisphosphate phosphatase
MKQCVFLERDGILNQPRGDSRTPASPLTRGEFQVCSEVAPLLNELKAAGFLLIVTTNQPGLSDGSLSRRELEYMHDSLKRTFPLDGIMVCPHEEMDRCTCRKPKPGMLVEAAHNWRLDLSRSFVISNKWQDAEAARRAGLTSLMLDSPWLGRGHHDFVLPDLPTLVEKLLQLNSPAAALAGVGEF